MKKSVYLVLAAAMLAVIVMPIAFAGAAGNQQTSANASLKKQLKGLKQRIAALESKPAPAAPTIPTTLPPSGPAAGDLAGTFPNPSIKAGAIKEGALATNSVTETKIAQESVSSEKIDNGAVSAIDMNLDSVGSYALMGVTAVIGPGVSVSAGETKTTTVTCPANQMLIAGGYGWVDKEANSIIASAPSEANPNTTWVVEGLVPAGSNTLYAWATCMGA